MWHHVVHAFPRTGRRTEAKITGTCCRCRSSMVVLCRRCGMGTIPRGAGGGREEETGALPEPQAHTALTGTSCLRDAPFSRHARGGRHRVGRSSWSVDGFQGRHSWPNGVSMPRVPFCPITAELSLEDSPQTAKTNENWDFVLPKTDHSDSEHQILDHVDSFHS